MNPHSMGPEQFRGTDGSSGGFIAGKTMDPERFRPTRPRHIVHLTNYFPGYHHHVGGAEHACRRTIQTLQQAGFRNTVLTLPFDRLPDASVSDSSIEVAPVRTFESIFPHGIRKFLEIIKWYAWQNDPLARQSAERLLSRTKPGIMQWYNSQFLGQGLLHLAKQRGIATSVTIYDYWLFCPLTTLMNHHHQVCRQIHGPSCLPCLPPPYPAAQKFFLRWRQRRFSHYHSLFDRFIVLSEASRRLLRDMKVPDRKIAVIPLPMDFSRFSPDHTPIEPGLLLFAGWFQKRKGVDVVLKAMASLIESTPQAHLEIFGMPVKWEKDYEETVARLLTEPRLAGRVKLITGSRPELLNTRLRQAQAVVIPEQWENMSPLLLIEAQALGQLVIASNIGGIPEFLDHGKTGFLFRRDDPDDLAHWIRQALSLSPTERENMGLRASASVRERFNSDRIMEKLRSFYQPEVE